MLKVKKQLKNKDLNLRGNVHIPSLILLVLGLIDLLRGFLHTFAVNWASDTFAKLDLSFAKNDQLFLLGTFGISNFLTGLLYILISQKAKNLSPYILMIIPFAYLLGLIGLRVAGITPVSAFEGRYFMIIYLAVSFFASVGYFVSEMRAKKK